MAVRDDLLSEFLLQLSKCHDLEEKWQVLIGELSRYHVERSIYVSKDFAKSKNPNSMHGAVFFSNYGDALNELLIESRNISNDYTSRCVIEAPGAFSWQLSRRAFLDGLMSEDEVNLHIRSRELGLVAGMTVGLHSANGQKRSGFGLCYEDGVKQAEVDAMWSLHGAEILDRLRIFEMTVSGLERLPKSQVLAEPVASVLQLVSEGKTNAEVATILGLHRRTVESRLAEARARMNVPTTIQATLKAYRQGQIA